MTQKERLIDIIQNSVGGCARNWAEIIADGLLSNGVIVPPVKVGQTVYTEISMRGWYFRSKDRPYSAKVVFIGLNDSEKMGGGLFNVVYEKDDGCMWQFNFSDIGKTVFLTKEEAEAALKESVGSDEKS